MAEYEGSERSRQKSNCEDTECRDQRHRGRIRREEEGRENRSEISIECEVIPFEHIADRSGEERFLCCWHRRHAHATSEPTVGQCVGTIQFVGCNRGACVYKYFVGSWDQKMGTVYFSDRIVRARGTQSSLKRKRKRDRLLN